MITAEFISLLFLAIVSGVGAIVLLILGIYEAITYNETNFCVGMIICFLVLSVLSGVMFNESYKEYKNTMPQNQMKILRQKISDAEKEYQKYLIDHPELKELSNIDIKE